MRQSGGDDKEMRWALDLIRRLRRPSRTIHKGQIKMEDGRVLRYGTVKMDVPIPPARPRSKPGYFDD